MDQIPKYSQIEFERRWLVDPKATDQFRRSPGKEIKDRYLSCGRLRVRSISDQGTITNKPLMDSFIKSRETHELNYFTRSCPAGS